MNPSGRVWPSDSSTAWTHSDESTQRPSVEVRDSGSITIISHGDHLPTPTTGLVPQSEAWLVTDIDSNRGYWRKDCEVSQEKKWWRGKYFKVIFGDFPTQLFTVEIIMGCLTSFWCNGEKMSVAAEAKLPLSNLHRLLGWNKVRQDLISNFFAHCS